MNKHTGVHVEKYVYVFQTTWQKYFNSRKDLVAKMAHLK